MLCVTAAWLHAPVWQTRAGKELMNANILETFSVHQKSRSSSGIACSLLEWHSIFYRFSASSPDTATKCCFPSTQASASHSPSNFETSFILIPSASDSPEGPYAPSQQGFRQSPRQQFCLFGVTLPLPSFSFFFYCWLKCLIARLQSFCSFSKSLN